MLFVVIFYLQLCYILKQADALQNIALNKVVQYCEDKNLTKKMVDGITEAGKNDEVIESKCRAFDFIEINLGGEYFVHFVVVYEGLRANKAQAAQLNYFSLDVIKVVGIYLVLHCGKFPGPSFGPNQPMRVNCGQSDTSVTYVKLSTNKDVGLSLAEIEVYTLGVASAENLVLYSRGCISDFEDEYSSKLESLLACQKTCSDKYFIMAIKNNQTCHCAYNYNEDSKVSAKQCNLKCNNPFYMCGGATAYSVYIVKIQLPSYYGCFDERFIAFRLPVKPYKILKENMLPGKCIRHCADANAYAIVKDDSCSCLNITTALNPGAFETCNQICSQDSLRVCGGANRLLSVYKTCLNASVETMTCYRLLRCNGLWDEYGWCNGGCEDNFEGEYCLEEVPDACSYDPCESENNTFCKVCKNSTVCQEPYTCECLPGFEFFVNACIPIVTTTTEPTTTSTKAPVAEKPVEKKTPLQSISHQITTEAVRPDDQKEGLSFISILVIGGATLLAVAIIIGAVAYWKHEKMLGNKVGAAKRESQLLGPVDE